MNAARQRALTTLEALKIRWHVFDDVYRGLFGALVEIERVRPIVEAAQAVVDAKSGEQLALARKALIDAVFDAREAVS